MAQIPLSLEQSIRISDLCSKLLATNKSLSVVAAINKHGRIYELKFRNDRATKELSEKEKEILFMQSMLISSIQKDFDNKFGISKFLMIEREKLTEFVFPFYEGILLILCAPQVNPRITRKLSKTINDFILLSEAEYLK